MRPSRLRVEGSAGRAPTLHQFLGPGICLTTEENHGKTSVRGNNRDVTVGVFIQEKVLLKNSLEPNPKERIQHSESGESLKSRITLVL